MDLLRIEIAGVCLTLLGDGLQRIQENSPAYEPFFAEDTDSAQLIHTPIRLSTENMPGLDGETKIFDSGQSWSMFRDGNQYWIMFHPPAFEQPLWLAVTNPDFSEVTLHCSEKLITRKNGKTVLSNPVRYPLDQVLLMYILAKRGGVLVHAAGIEINGQAFIFPGKSGAGKTTLTQQFVSREHIGLFSDDRMVVRKMDGILKAFGTPWPGEAKIAVNKSAPLAGLFFIHHGSKNVMKEIKPQQALESLLPVISVPWYDQETFPNILAFCEELIDQVPAYEFHFEPTGEAVDAFEAFVAKC